MNVCLKWTLKDEGVQTFVERSTLVAEEDLAIRYAGADEDAFAVFELFCPVV